MSDDASRVKGWLDRPFRSHSPPEHSSAARDKISKLSLGLEAERELLWPVLNQRKSKAKIRDYAATASFKRAWRKKVISRRKSNFRCRYFDSFSNFSESGRG